MWALNSACVYQQMKQLIVGATSPHVNIRDIRESWIPAPPSEEQTRIAAYVSRNLSSLDQSCGTLKVQIERLQEYRQALITAAVTGQLGIEGEVT